jgi:glutathione S-transferase
MKNLTLLELEDAMKYGVESLSPFCLKVHRALIAAGLDYERRHGDRPSAHRDHNRLGQVPVLLIDDRPVIDSTAILRRLVVMRPRAIDAQPEAWLWEEFADTSLNGFVVAARWADLDNWPRTRAAYFGGMPAPFYWFVPSLLRRRVMKNLVARDVWRGGALACWDHFLQILDDLEARAPEQGFWLGEKLSVADIAMFAQLHSLRTTLTEKQHRWIEERRKLRLWLNRVDEATTSHNESMKEAA